MHLPRPIRRRLAHVLLLLAGACGSSSSSSPTADASAGGAADARVVADAGSPDGPTCLTATIKTYPHPIGSGAGPANARLLASQQGDGPWRVETGSNGVYAIPVCARYAVAHVCVNAHDVSVNIVHTTADELSEISLSCATREHLVQGTAAIGAGETANIYASGTGSFVSGTPPEPYSVELDPGLNDLIAVVSKANSVSKIAMIRDRMIDGPTTLDFDLGTAVAPEPRSVKLTGDTANETIFLRSFFVTARGVKAFLTQTNTESLVLPFVPQSSHAAGDNSLYVVYASSDDNPKRNRNALHFFRGPETLTLSLPPAYVGVALTAETTTPYVRPTAKLPAKPDAAFLRVRVANGELAWTATFTPGWLGAGTATYTFEDLSGLAGWSSAWGLPHGDLEGMVEAVSSNRERREVFQLDVDSDRMVVPAGTDVSLNREGFALNVP